MGVTMTRPLSDVTVLDLTWILSGPFAFMILCDMGADVIKVDRPPYGDIARTTGPYVGDESGYFFSVNRGKKSICVDLRNPAGKDTFLRVLAEMEGGVGDFMSG